MWDWETRPVFPCTLVRSGTSRWLRRCAAAYLRDVRIGLCAGVCTSGVVRRCCVAVMFMLVFLLFVEGPFVANPCVAITVTCVHSPMLNQVVLHPCVQRADSVDPIHH